MSIMPMRMGSRAVCWTVSLLLLLAGAACRAPQRQSPPTLKVMTYNIRIGAGGGAWPSDPKQLDLEPAARVIASQQPDLAGLQEVDRFRPRSANVDQPGWLSQRLGMKATFAPGYTIPVDGAPAEEYGVALLTSHSTASISRFPLYKPDYRQTHPEYPDYYSEQRVLLYTPVTVRGRTVHVFVTHLGLTVDQREKQLAQIAEITARYSGPKLLMGDFNAHPDEPALAKLRSQFEDALEVVGTTAEARKSYPGGLQPNEAIDYIFASKEFKVRAARVIRDASLASDHNPVIAELELQ